MIAAINKFYTVFQSNFFALKGSPKRIAKGFALGSFVGMMPIPGIQMLVSFTIAALFNMHKKAACLGVIFKTNIFTAVFIFSFNYWVGKNIMGTQTNFVFPDRMDLDFIGVLLSAGKDVLISLTIGGMVTGGVSAFLTYHIVFLWFKKRNLR